MSCTIVIDGKEIKTKKGRNLLWAALDADIYIPNLCSIEHQCSPASCRLCFVGIEGVAHPVISCAETVRDGMIVHLDTKEVVRLRKSSFDLLLSNHHLDCKHCVKNGKCELQNIAHREGWKLNRRFYPDIHKLQPIDTSHPDIVFDPNKCILCGKCVWICKHTGNSVLDFAYRGIQTRVSTFTSIPLADSGCDSCFACADICPVGSIFRK